MELEDVMIELDGYDYGNGPTVSFQKNMDMFNQPAGTAMLLGLEVIEFLRPVLQPLCIRLHLKTRTLPEGFLDPGFAEPSLWRIRQPIPAAVAPPVAITDDIVESEVDELTQDVLCDWVHRALEQAAPGGKVVAMESIMLECGLVFLGVDEVAINYRQDRFLLAGDNGWFPVAWSAPLWALCELEIVNCTQNVEMTFRAGCDAWSDVDSVAGSTLLECGRGAAEQGWGVSYKGRRWPGKGWDELPRVTDAD